MRRLDLAVDVVVPSRTSSSFRHVPKGRPGNGGPEGTWFSPKASKSGQRKFNVAIVLRRAKGNGRITRIEGLEQSKRKVGHSFIHDALLRPGTPRRNWKSTLLSDGHLLLRHPDFDEAKRLAFAATDITMYAE